ncbi:putative signal peptide peptidase SppA [bacterium BMS3Bbin06]|nr:putative signal peptide peptidase SppA [bacterium BMS3Abin08]GBE35410.1 putative signal peptide peptidase SppA [bacterium BMS3Bbin06]HDO35144.1 signal peptide peptidase SppA [Nitrospirota bacterium]
MKKLCFIISGLLFATILFSVVFALISRNMPIGEKVALVKVVGPIVSSSDVINELTKYRKDSSVKSVILRVDSPGGAVAPSQEIYEEVEKLRKEKPVVVSMGSVAASGGYYIAAPATKIFANPGTVTGSIGVIMEIPNVKGLMDKLGIKTEVIKSGRHKDLASVFRGIGKEERQILQNVLDDVHKQFIRAVSKGRNIPYDVIKKIADGRVFTGRQAKEKGLVDELGNLQDAIMEAARLGGIKGEPRVVTKKEKTSVLEFLTGSTPDRFRELFTFIKLNYMMYY